MKVMTAIANKIPEPELRAQFAAAAIHDFNKAVAELRAKREKEGKNFFGKLVKGAGQVFGTIGEGVANAVKKGVAFGVKIIGNVALAPLIPFVPAMKKEIKKKGKAPKGDLPGLANQFRQVVLAKQAYDCYDNGEFISSKYKKNYLAPLAAGALVKLIMDYFNNIKAKVAAGEPLTKQEEDILEAVEAGEKAVKEGVLDEVDKKTGGWLRENWKPIAIIGGSVVAAGLIYVGVRAAKKAA